MRALVDLLIPKNIIYLLCAVFILLWLDIGRVENFLLHFFEPTSIEVGRYKITLRKKHWGYLKEDARAHYILGKDGLVVLEVLKDPHNQAIKDEFLQCFDNKIKHTKHNNMKGKIIVCEMPLKLIFYFQSSDDELLIRSELNEPMSKYHMDEYINFLEGIKKY